MTFGSGSVECLQDFGLHLALNPKPLNPKPNTEDLDLGLNLSFGFSGFGFTKLRAQTSDWFAAWRFGC